MLALVCQLVLKRAQLPLRGSGLAKTGEGSNPTRPRSNTEVRVNGLTRNAMPSAWR